ncbi:OmpP1/FadL family transporter [Flavihumibacter profundi]|uniref:OmpP1/FadL family transporter n=1 Tax=Flavihumibacter profundi TaxID=2716883 RepID=UPI001CC58F87|nr:hypothetical protein [Flavihumibacter profundi]MBZ5856658.1 hypothetical protein [Flavihumibacter profundi]
MRKALLAVSISFIATGLNAQIPEDAIRMSWATPSGTARNQAIGGVNASLGGDITSNFINPAGIALYRTSEVVFTPGYNFYNNKADYRGTNSGISGNNFMVGTSGFVFGINDQYRANRSSAFSIAVNRSVNFNNHISYTGSNNYSSFSEGYAAEIANSGLSLDEALNSSNISFPARMAIYTYLVDTLSMPGGMEVVGTPLRYAYKNDTAFILNQANNIETKGGVTEIAISYGGNHNDKFYWGASLGIPILNYERNSTLTETDASSNDRNYFKSGTLHEFSTTKGVGMNLKLGIIFKPVDNIRVGLALHTPTIYGLQETYDATMETKLENYNEPTAVNVSTLNSNTLPVYKYDYTSPWKFMVSGSYVFHEVADVKQQKGFISADLEYVTFSSNRFHNGEVDNIPIQDYYNAVNNVVKQIYKGAFNAKIGGELKFNTLMARAGFAYYGNPYKDQQIKGDRLYISGGLGYRNKGYFVDLTYVYRLTNDVSFPYRLTDKANTYADINGAGGNVVMTVGMKF